MCADLYVYILKKTKLGVAISVSRILYICQPQRTKRFRFNPWVPTFERVLFGSESTLNSDGKSDSSRTNYHLSLYKVLAVSTDCSGSWYAVNTEIKSENVFLKATSATQAKEEK